MDIEENTIIFTIPTSIINVTSYIKSIPCSLFNKFIKDKITTKTIHPEVSYPKEIEKNKGHSIWGSFYDYLIRREISYRLKIPITDGRALYILPFTKFSLHGYDHFNEKSKYFESIDKEDKEQCIIVDMDNIQLDKIYDRLNTHIKSNYKNKNENVNYVCKILCVKLGDESSDPDKFLNNCFDDINSFSLLFDIFYSWIYTYKNLIKCNGTMYCDISDTVMLRLMNSYFKFIDLSNKTIDILEDIYNVSLCHSLFFGRQDIPDINIKKCLKEFNYEYVSRYVTSLLEISTDVDLNPVFGVRELNLQGDGDIIRGSTLIDIKCSKKKSYINQGFLQVMCYELLHRYKGGVCKSITIYSPLLGVEYSIDMKDIILQYDISLIKSPESILTKNYMCKQTTLADITFE